MTLVPLMVLLSVGSISAPAFGQALVPRTLEIETRQLDRTGMILLREAVQLAQFQQFDAALSRAQLASKLIPTSADVWALLGGLYLNQENLEEGIASLERARDLSSENPGVHFSLGSAYFRQGQYESAQKALEAGLKLRPNAPEALFDLGNTYFMLGRHRQAIAQYKQAFDQDDQFWPAVNNIGLVEYEIGNVQSAMQSWQAAIDIDDTSSEPKLAMAVALYAQGQTDTGLKLAEQALQLDSRYGDVEFLRENLWGDRLITAARVVLNSPRIRATLAQGQVQPLESRNALD
uniref:tetratricopeptide repeat protein n=1 Tax=Petrachloros mirabilis TaxID=2918835 RepID=UPI001EE98DCB|nr:tetratricopeptide repeat protein [Petrachloros mirabilis]